jgi:hypothetical protein
MALDDLGRGFGVGDRAARAHMAAQDTCEAGRNPR